MHAYILWPSKRNEAIEEVEEKPDYILNGIFSLILPGVKSKETSPCTRYY